MVGEKRNNVRDNGLVLNTKISSPQSSADSSSDEEIGFDFRKQHFTYSKELNKFCKLQYPTKEAFGTYAKSTGHGSETKALAGLEKWGKNMYVFLLDLTCFYRKAL